MDPSSQAAFPSQNSTFLLMKAYLLRARAQCDLRPQQSSQQDLRLSLFAEHMLFVFPSDQLALQIWRKLRYFLEGQKDALINNDKLINIVILNHHSSDFTSDTLSTIGSASGSFFFLGFLGLRAIFGSLGCWSALSSFLAYPVYFFLIFFCFLIGLGLPLLILLSNCFFRLIFRLSLPNEFY